MTSRNHKLRRQALALCFAVPCVLTGCGTHPWVKPYERDALTDPLLSIRTDSLSDLQREKAVAVNQGARGALGLPGDGCGCD